MESSELEKSIAKKDYIYIMLISKTNIFNL